MSIKWSQEDAVGLLRNEFLGEFQRMHKSVHHLINHLAAISGYVQIALGQPGRSAPELHKIIHAVEKSMAMLRACVANLKEIERRHS